MSKYSRDKGVSGERDIARKVKGKRVGVAFKHTAIDVSNGWSDIQVKNKPLSSGAILEALRQLEAESPPEKAHYVVFKARRGTWLVVERLEQHISHHVGE